MHYGRGGCAHNTFLIGNRMNYSGFIRQKPNNTPKSIWLVDCSKTLIPHL
jgi:hypothetical protein